MSLKVNIVEVGMRDGLQNENRQLSIEQRVEFAKRLSKVGYKRIEAGAFVSPTKVPQMAGSGKVLEQILQAQKNKLVSPTISFSALVPNERGYLDARAAGVKEIALFGAVSETFCQKNINCSVEESFERFQIVMAQAKKDKVKVRGYVSTVFGCPYEGKIKPTKALKVIERFFELGIFELSIGDTIGVATPKQVDEILKPFKKSRQIKKVAMHFHDTRGTAIANISRSLEYGVTTFDSSVGGLGGCPYAPGAAGNVATEDVVYFLEGMGIKTGLNLDALLEVSAWMTTQLDRPMVSSLSAAGRSCIY